MVTQKETKEEELRRIRRELGLDTEEVEAVRAELLDAQGASMSVAVMAERIREFEGQGREGSPFARGVGLRDPAGPVLNAIEAPARVGAAFSSEVIGLERSLAERIGIPGRIVDPFDVAPNTATQALFRGDLGPDAGLGAFTSEINRLRSERNLGQNILLEVGADPLNIVPGVGFTQLGRRLPSATGSFRFAPQSLVSEGPTARVAERALPTREIPIRPADPTIRQLTPEQVTALAPARVADASLDDVVRELGVREIPPSVRTPADAAEVLFLQKQREPALRQFLMNRYIEFFDFRQIDDLITQVIATVDEAGVRGLDALRISDNFVGSVANTTTGQRLADRPGFQRLIAESERPVQQGISLAELPQSPTPLPEAPGLLGVEETARLDAERLQLAADPAGPAGPPPIDPRFAAAGMEQPFLPGLGPQAPGIPKRLANALTQMALLLRSLGASGELSGLLRQGGAATLAHPIEARRALGKSLRTVFSEQNALDIEALRSRAPTFQTNTNAGLHTSIRGSVQAGEEFFMSEWIRHIPGLKQFVNASERTFTVFLNELRHSIMDTVVGSWQRAGKNITDQDMRALATFINHLTGRGDLGFLEKVAPQLTAVFWAPRLALSYPQLLVDMFKPGTSRLVRQQIWRDLGISVGTGGVILGLLDQLPGAEVTTDPRSSDFGKVQIGATRYNFFGGAQTIARSFAQAATGSAKSISTNEVFGRDWEKTVKRFLRFKLAPLTGLAADVAPALPIIPGEPSDPIGREIDTSIASLGGTAFRKLLPLFYQDMIEAARQEGLIGAAQTLPGFLGIGVQTFETPLEKFAKERFGITERLRDLSDQQIEDIADAFDRENNAKERQKELDDAIKEFQQQDDELEQMIQELTN